MLPSQQPRCPARSPSRAASCRCPATCADSVEAAFIFRRPSTAPKRRHAPTTAASAIACGPDRTSPASARPDLLPEGRRRDGRMSAPPSAPSPNSDTWGNASAVSIRCWDATSTPSTRSCGRQLRQLPHDQRRHERPGRAQPLEYRGAAKRMQGTSPPPRPTRPLPGRAREHAPKVELGPRPAGAAVLARRRRSARLAARPESSAAQRRRALAVDRLAAGVGEVHRVVVDRAGSGRPWRSRSSRKPSLAAKASNASLLGQVSSMRMPSSARRQTCRRMLPAPISAIIAS